MIKAVHAYKSARVEQSIGKLKRFQRVAMRREKTDVTYSAIVGFACGLMLVRSVQTAQRDDLEVKEIPRNGSDQ
jgi:hypothetical protein